MKKIKNRNKELENTNNKIIEDDRIILNTEHYAIQAVETDEGVVIDVFVRHGELLDSFTYWNEGLEEL